MQNFFEILFFLSLLGLIIGLISPKLVIRWGSKRTRGRVFLIYGLAMVVFLILVGVTAPPTEQEKERPVVAPTPTNEIRTQKGHPFLEDIKEAYKDSKLTYDRNVKRLLFSKLPKPQNEFERSGLDILKPPKTKNAEEEQILGQTIEALHRQFFKKVKTGGRYCPIDEIKRQYGQSPEERIGISSGGYYRLFVAYWTLNAKLRAYHEINISKHGYANIYYLDKLLSLVESNLAGAFFPTPGPYQISESQRRQGIQEMLKAFAPGMTIKELYEGADPQKAKWPILK